MSSHPYFIADTNNNVLELYDTTSGRWTQFEVCAVRFMTLTKAVGVAKTCLRDCSVVSRDGNGKLLNHYTHLPKSIQ